MSLSVPQRHTPISNDVTRDDLVRVQENLCLPLDVLAKNPVLDGVLLEDITLTAGVENWIEHGLGRTIRGWIESDKQASAVVWRVTSSSADLTKYLPLGATAGVTLDLWVY